VLSIFYTSVGIGARTVPVLPPAEYIDRRTCPGMPWDFSPTNCTSTYEWGSGTIRSKQHLDRFSRFCRADDRDRQAERPTDLATPSVTIGHIYVVL